MRMNALFTKKYVGEAKVRDVFDSPKFGKMAGCIVVEGLISRDHRAEVVRDNRVIAEDLQVVGLRRFQDDAMVEVPEGFECGVRLAEHDDIEPGDVIRTYVDRVTDKQPKNPNTTTDEVRKILDEKYPGPHRAWMPARATTVAERPSIVGVIPGGGWMAHFAVVDTNPRYKDVNPPVIKSTFAEPVVAWRMYANGDLEPVVIDGDGASGNPSRVSSFVGLWHPELKPCPIRD